MLYPLSYEGALRVASPEEPVTGTRVADVTIRPPTFPPPAPTG